jgi:hypothetical protein
VSFEEALAELGFTEERSSRGVRHYARRPTRFLTFWVQVHEDGGALFTWEFAIAEYVATLGLQVGSDEHLNTFLFPKEDVRGPQDPAWLAEQIDDAETVLRSMSFVDGQAQTEVN